MITELTKREYEVAELLAWGASKKEVANDLFISVFTVENHARSTFEKLGCNSVNELSAIWFCERYSIEAVSPRKSKFSKSISLLLAIIITPQIFLAVDTDALRPASRPTTVRVQRVRTRRETESIFEFI
ncbi:MAG: response regulator transcription factor [Bacteroidales bacterium]